MKTGLVLEGGALRTIFSSGVCDAFLNEKLPMPDYTIGLGRDCLRRQLPLPAEAAESPAADALRQ